MTLGPDWVIVDEAGSTQTLAAERLKSGLPGDVFFAHHQAAGRGRFQRVWQSRRGSSLTFSVAFRSEKGRQEPWLLGMAVAVVAAETVDCWVQWPNDLTLGDKKVGGVLTEIVEDVPVVGIGLNLGPGAVPAELASAAAWIETDLSPLDLADTLVRALRRTPSPAAWPELAERWAARDRTPGKTYRLADGTVLEARGVGEDGRLVGTTGTGTQTVYAAEALFGPDPQA